MSRSPRLKEEPDFVYGCKYEGCRCQGVVKNKKRSRTPTFNSYDYRFRGENGDYEPYRGCGGRLV